MKIPSTIGCDDFAQIDIRAGTILAAAPLAMVHYAPEAAVPSGVRLS